MLMKNHRKELIGKTMAGMSVILLTVCINSCTSNRQDYSKTHNDDVKKMEINEIIHEGSINIDLASELLESHADIQKIETINWASFTYKPEVKFRIAYWQDQIWLKYYVNEESIMAKETSVNGNVYKDSCVEFFISPDGNDAYYNFEFNCIGIPHVSYGSAGAKRVLIDPEILELVTVKSSLGDKPFKEKIGGHQWEMMIIIPKACFAHDEDLVLKGLKATANFYKCGDDTSKPHYVTWNSVGTKKPDYHQPKYFGELSFE